MPNIPCLLIGFAREEELIRIFRQGVDAGIRKFYVSLDGPTTELIAKKQLKIIEELERSSTIAGVDVYVQTLEGNLGSGAAVISAINWLLNNEDSGIILEDDLEVDNEFFYYMKETLDYYKDDSRVLAISGFNPFQEHSKSNTNSLVSYPVSWGWATSKDKWEVMSDLLFSKPPIRSWRNPVLASYWHTGKSRALEGKIDAWDIPLAASMRFTKYVTILPPVNLVTNMGSDIFASHTQKMEWPLGIQRRSLPKDWKNQDVSSLIDLSKLFENQIYKIRFKNILSFPISKILDSRRFKVSRGPMLKLLSQHSSKKFSIKGQRK
jgi:hypothetical protein